MGIAEIMRVVVTILCEVETDNPDEAIDIAEYAVDQYRTDVMYPVKISAMLWEV